MADPQPLTEAFRARCDELARRSAAGEFDRPDRPVEQVDVPRGPAPLPARFSHANLAQLDGKLAATAARWVDGGMNANVLLLGNVGVGKTHAACAMAAAAWQVGSTIRFAPVVELLDELRPGGPPAALARALAVDVLVLDDLGGERPTDWTGERLYALVNRRWLEQRPTIVTSNLAPETLEAAVGARVWSRLYHDAVTLKIPGADRRRQVPA